MTTFKVTTPSGEVLTGLSTQDLGNAFMRAWAGEWRVDRRDDGKWQLMARSLAWYPTPIIVAGDNEEQANKAACEGIALDSAWAYGFKVEAEPEVAGE